MHPLRIFSSAATMVGLASLKKTLQMSNRRAARRSRNERGRPDEAVPLITVVREAHLSMFRLRHLRFSVHDGSPRSRSARSGAMASTPA